MQARIARAIVTTAVGLVALSAGVVHHRATTAWAAVEQRRADLDAAEANPMDLRDVFWGEARDGEAVRHYERAIAAADLGDDHGLVVRTFPMADDGEAAALTADLRARHRLVLDELRLGAHCRDGRAYPPTPGPLAVATPDLLRLRAVVNLGMLEVRALRHAGQGRAAVELTLDVATFAADHTQPDMLIRTMIGVALCAIVADGWPDDALKNLDAEALALFASGLAKFDARLPDALACGPELRYTAAALVDGAYVLPTFQAWRYGFSTRWMLAEGFLAYDRVVRQMDASPTAWAERSAAFETAIAPLAASPNPVAATIVPNLRAAEHNLREAKTRLRMLRLAVDLHRGHTPPDLQDPLGQGPLRVDPKPGHCTIVSRGERNGKPISRDVARPGPY